MDGTEQDEPGYPAVEWCHVAPEDTIRYVREVIDEPFGSGLVMFWSEPLTVRQVREVGSQVVLTCDATERHATGVVRLTGVARRFPPLMIDIKKS